MGNTVRFRQRSADCRCVVKREVFLRLPSSSSCHNDSKILWGQTNSMISSRAHLPSPRAQELSPPGQIAAGEVLAGIVWKFFERVEAVPE